MREQRPDVRNKLVRDKKLSAELEAGLKEALETFQKQYKAPA
jgi:hypothetical protein